MMPVWPFADPPAKATSNWTSTPSSASVWQDISTLKENAELAHPMPSITAEKKFVTVSRTTFSTEEDVFQQPSDPLDLQNYQLVKETARISIPLE